MNASCLPVLVIDDAVDPRLPANLGPHASLVQFHQNLSEDVKTDLARFGAVFVHQSNRDGAHDYLVEKSGFERLIVRFSGGQTTLEPEDNLASLSDRDAMRRLPAFLAAYVRHEGDSLHPDVVQSLYEDASPEPDDTSPLPRHVVKFVYDGARFNEDATLDALDALTAPHELVVPLKGEGRLQPEGLDLLRRLRFSPARPLSRWPVLVTGADSLDVLLRGTPERGLLVTPGTRYASSAEALNPARLGDVLTNAQLREALDRLALAPHRKHDVLGQLAALLLWRTVAPSEPLPDALRDAEADVARQPWAARELARLALEPSPASTPWPPTADAWARHVAAGGRKPRLLLVDDHAPLWAPVLERLLDARIVSVDLSGTPDDLVAAAVDAAGAARYDAVLCDLRLHPNDHAASRAPADLTGERIAAEIKDRAPFLPVLVLTASRRADVHQDLLQSGADGFWTKPIAEPLQAANALRRALASIVQRYHDAAPVYRLYDAVAPMKHDEDAALSEGSRRLFDALATKAMQAYGLLVEAPSRFSSHTFALDRTSLAFLHLWSGVNDLAPLVSSVIYQNDKVDHILVDAPGLQRFSFNPKTDNFAKPDGKGAPDDRSALTLLHVLHRHGWSEAFDRLNALRLLRNPLALIHGKAHKTTSASAADIADLAGIWFRILFPPAASPSPCPPIPIPSSPDRQDGL